MVFVWPDGMVHVHHIDTLDLAALGPYRTMRRQTEHRAEGIFVAESEKVVRRLLESRFEVVSLLLPMHWLEKFQPLLAARPEEIHVYLMEKHRLESLTGFTFYQGILAVGRIPEMPSLEGLCDQSRPPRLFVGVEGITNAENLGGLVRNCAAFAVQGLLVDRTSCSPFLRRAVRGSMGTVFRIPAVENLNLVEAIAVLRRHGIRSIAAHPHTNERRISQACLRKDCCVFFGSEGYGISPDLLQACDDAVAIPMAAGIDSLNVGAAAAVFLYEVDRQRREHATGPLRKEV